MTDVVSLLLRRAGFGPTSAELQRARTAGYAATLAALTAPTGSDPGAATAPLPKLGLDPYADTPNPTMDQRNTFDLHRKAQTDVIIRWWLDRMTVANHQAVEKALFFWHGHWATSIDKVMSPQLMLRQHRTLREAPNFVEMARRMVRDPALVYWLDGHLNTRSAPNENLGRELMELFVLGIGNYTEQDVKEAGRALTGWWVSLGSEEALFNAADFDSSDKTVLGLTGMFNADNLVGHLVRQPTCPKFIAARMWYRYASSTEPIPPSTQLHMVGAFPAPMAMLRAMFQHEEFQATAGRMPKSPVEWLVGAMRQLKLRPANFSDAVFTQIRDGLRGLGQLPFAPLSVGGWPGNGAWLTSAAAQIRLGLAATLANLTTVQLGSTEQLADTLAVDTWTDRTFAVLHDIADPRLRLTVGLASPEYLVT